MKLIGAGILVLAVGLIGSSAEAAKKKHVAAASGQSAREECIKQAMDRVNSLMPGTNNAEKNATGVSEYRNCAASRGIRP
jgi:hypothetical protein